MFPHLSQMKTLQGPCPKDKPNRGKKLSSKDASLFTYKKRSAVKKPDSAGWNCRARMGDNSLGIYRFTV